MDVKKYVLDGVNTGKLKQTNEKIIIKPRRWVTKDGKSYPMKSSAPISFENKNVYFLPYPNENNTIKGVHISLNFWQKQKFLFLQKAHWLQKEENIRYIINMLVLISTVVVGVLNYLK